MQACVLRAPPYFVVSLEQHKLAAEVQGYTELQGQVCTLRVIQAAGVQDMKLICVLCQFIYLCVVLF